MQLKVLLLCCGSLLAQGQYARPAADYFVDGLHGSDSNSGTNPGHPFLTVGKATSVIVAGQLIAVYGGSTGQHVRYGEQVTLPSAGVGLTGYGESAPLFDCSTPISSGSWSKTGGFTNIYQATVTTDNVNGFLRLWENDVSFSRAASLAALDAVSTGYFVSGDPTGGGGGPTSFTMYVHASGDSNPGSNGNTYEYNTRGYGIFSNVASVVSNVSARRNLANNGSIEVGQGSRLYSIEADDGTKHNALLHGGSYLRGATFNNSYYAGQDKVALVVNDNDPGGLDITIENAVYTETLETTGVGFFGHVNAAGAFGTVTLKNCSTVGAATSVSGFTSSAMIVQNGTYNAGITAGSSTVNLLKNLTISGQVQLLYAVPVELDTVSVSGAFTNGAVRIQGAVTNLNIHGSTFSNSTAFDGALYFDSAAGVFTFLNNTLLTPVQTNHFQGAGTSSLPANATINGNTYHYPTGMSSWINYRGTTYDISSSGWAAWQALGFDASGSRVTP